MDTNKNRWGFTMIKIIQEPSFKPIKVEITLNTFEEFETFVSRLCRNTDFSLPSTRRYPEPKIHKYQLGPNGTNNITDELYKTFKKLKGERS